MQGTKKLHMASADDAFDIVWDNLGVAHVYARNIADAYRGMGYAAASERLWQIHMSTAFANAEAAALLGPRFIAQDALQRAADVPGKHHALPPSDGDWIADAYLEGMNAYIEQLDELPPEFLHAGAEPRPFNRADIAARYRFTSWFQHKSWTEKLLLGHLMTRHGVEYFRHHVLHFSAEDEKVLDALAPALDQIDPGLFALAYPEVSLAALTGAVPGTSSGSNNWAVTGALTHSGKGMLATDPHQPHSIPNTFFYVHLHAGDWDTFGAAFPGVPYFMMGYNRHLAWGLTTGFVDAYDTYIEEVDGTRYRRADDWLPLSVARENIAVKDAPAQEIDIYRTVNGPLLEPLLQALSMHSAAPGRYQTALHWSLTDVPTSAGALAQLPLATSAAEFGHLLFENDVCPLVNNIICVDTEDGLRRFIATTLPARQGVTGSVPLPGWDPRYSFTRSDEASLTVEVDPQCGFTFTANNDTMGESGPFYIHTFPANSARADRIEAMLTGREDFTMADFEAMQLDLTDLRARRVCAELVPVLAAHLEDPDAAPQIRQAHDLLCTWDGRAEADSAAACLFYAFQDRFWPRRFMRRVLGNPLINAIPVGAPGLNLFDLSHFLMPGSPWLEHREQMHAEIVRTMVAVFDDLTATLGEDANAWRWGALHQVQFQHSLARHDTWSHLKVGPDAVGGSPTTLNMAMHMGPGPGRSKPGEIPNRVYHGPAYRLIVNLADPDHASFVIAGGNGGRPDSPYCLNHYERWLKGENFTLSLVEAELTIDQRWQFNVR